jgi:hypothetical protein
MEQMVTLPSLQTFRGLGGESEKGGVSICMKLKFEADITLMLREQDINLLLKAIEQYSPENEAERHIRFYLLDLLGYLATD